MNRSDIGAREVIVRGLQRVGWYARHCWSLYVIRDPQTVWVRKWYRDGSERALRYDYPLTRSSVVLDLGGYKGDWAAEIHQRYRCKIYVFEPIPEYCRAIASRFEGIEDVRALDVALASGAGTATISINAEGSSTYRTGSAQQLPIKLVEMRQFLSTAGIKSVDLIKINIEGGEYDLLEYMIREGIAGQCADIQVQFHRFVPDAEERRNAIRAALEQTHRLTYDYPFVWENWRRR